MIVYFTLGLLRHRPDFRFAKWHSNAQPNA